jgi:hypothetical protein
LESRDRGKLREALLLTFLGTLITMMGWWIKPPNDSPVVFSGQFIVQVPSMLLDAKNQQDPVETVQWREGHGTNSSQALDLSRPNATPDTTRVILVVLFDHDPEAPITVNFDLPAEATLDYCRADLGFGFSPCKMQPSGSHLATRSNRVVRTSGVLHSQFLSMEADLGHTNGLGFATNRKDATVRYPLVTASDVSPAEAADTEDVIFPRQVQVTTEVHFDGASDVRWTQNPSSGWKGTGQWDAGTPHAKTFNDDFSAWDYRFSPVEFNLFSSAHAPPNIGGSSVSVSSKDTDRVFYAGLAFGVAGAGYMAALQALFVWLASGSGSGTSATVQRRRMRLRA